MFGYLWLLILVYSIQNIQEVKRTRLLAISSSHVTVIKAALDFIPLESYNYFPSSVLQLKPIELYRQGKRVNLKVSCVVR